MLLGLDRSMLDAIEAGARHSWTCSITFSRKVPPPSHLGKAVEAGMFKCAAQENERKRYCRGKRSNRDKKTHPWDILELMEPSDRAMYLLQQHCRYSATPTRPLDYLVRCKPLSDRAVHLNHTEVDVLAPGLRGSVSSQGVATYSLPPLKLSLADCCNPSSTSRGLVEQTFDVIETMAQEDV